MAPASWLATPGNSGALIGVSCWTRCFLRWPIPTAPIHRVCGSGSKTSLQGSLLDIDAKRQVAVGQDSSVTPSDTPVPKQPSQLTTKASRMVAVSSTEQVPASGAAAAAAEPAGAPHATSNRTTSAGATNVTVSRSHTQQKPKRGLSFSARKRLSAGRPPAPKPSSLGESLLSKGKDLIGLEGRESAVPPSKISKEGVQGADALHAEGLSPASPQVVANKRELGIDKAGASGDAPKPVTHSSQNHTRPPPARPPGPVPSKDELLSLLLTSRRRRYAFQQLTNILPSLDAQEVALLLKAGCQLGDFRPVASLLERIKGMGMSLALENYSLSLHITCQRMHWRLALHFLNDMISEGVPPSTQLMMSVLHCCARNERWQEVMGVLAAMRGQAQPPNADAYSLAVGVLSRAGRTKDIRDVLSWMEEDKVQPDLRHYSYFIKPAAADEISTTDRQWVQEHMARMGVELDAQHYIMQAGSIMEHWLEDASTQYCDRYKRLKDNVDAALERIEQGDTASMIGWNILVNGLSRLSRGRRAMRVLDMMRAAGVPPNVITYTTAINALRREGQFAQVTELAETMRAEGIQLNLWTYNSLLVALSKQGDWEGAVGLLEEMTQNNVEADRISYSALLNTLKTQGQWQQAKDLLMQIRAMHVERGSLSELDPFLYLTALRACVDAGQIEAAREVLRDMVSTLERWETSKQQADWGYVFTAMVHASVTTLRLSDAVELLKEMTSHRLEAPLNLVVEVMAALADRHPPLWELALDLLRHQQTLKTPPDLIVYNSALTALAHGGQTDLCFTVLEEMIVERGIRPDQVTMSIMLKSLDEGGKGDRALDLLGSMKKEYGVEPEVYSYTTVMGLLARRGDIPGAVKLLRELQATGRQPTLKTYAAVIHGCQLGDGRYWSVALELLEEIRASGEQADLTIHNAVLSALNQAGRPNETLQLYRSMEAEGAWMSHGSYRRVMETLYVGKCYQDILDIVVPMPVSQKKDSTCFRYGLQAALKLQDRAAAVKLALELVQNSDQWWRRYTITPHTVGLAVSVLSYAGMPDKVELLLSHINGYNVEVSELALRELLQGCLFDGSTNRLGPHVMRAFRAKGVKITSKLYSEMLQICIKEPWDVVWGIVKDMRADHCPPTLLSHVAAVISLSRCGQFGKAVELAEELALTLGTRPVAVPQKGHARIMRALELGTAGGASPALADQLRGMFVAQPAPEVTPPPPEAAVPPVHQEQAPVSPENCPDAPVSSVGATVAAESSDHTNLDGGGASEEAAVGSGKKKGSWTTTLTRTPWWHVTST